MNHVLVLYLPYPPSFNHYWRNWRGHTVISAQGRAYRQFAILEVKRQWKGQAWPCPVEVCYTVTRPDRRRRDIGNLEKVLSDVLTAAGVWKDDCQVQRNTQEWATVPANAPGVLVTITETRERPYR